MAAFLNRLLHHTVEYPIRLKNAPPSATRESVKQVKVYWWGLVREKIELDNCFGNGLSSVTVRKSLRQFLTGIFTLGIIAPITIVWQCAKDNDFREPINQVA